MKVLACFLFIGIFLLGCAGHKHRGSQSNSTSLSGSAKSSEKLIVTPETMRSGKVTVVNEKSRFVVLNFPIGTMPAVETRLNVYRRGLRVGELKVTGPQREDNTVADIMSGEAGVGDEVRAN